MRIVKRVGDSFVVHSESGNEYIVSLKELSCSCPHYLYRVKGRGTCKHIDFVTEEVREEVGASESVYSEVKSLVREGIIETSELVKKYSDELIKQMVFDGELFEKQGRVFVLE